MQRLELLIQKLRGGLVIINVEYKELKDLKSSPIYLYRDTTSYHDFPRYYFTRDNVKLVDCFNPETNSYDKKIAEGADIIELSLEHIIPVITNELVENTLVLKKFSDSYDPSLYNKPTYRQARQLIANTILMNRYTRVYLKNLLSHMIIRATPKFVDDLIDSLQRRGVNEDNN